MFDVRLISLEPRNGADPAAVLVRVFNLEIEGTGRLAESLPRVVKRGVSREYADKLVAKLAGIGAKADVVPSSGATPKDVPAAAKDSALKKPPAPPAPSAPQPSRAAQAASRATAPPAGAPAAAVMGAAPGAGAGLFSGSTGTASLPVSPRGGTGPRLSRGQPAPAVSDAARAPLAPALLTAPVTPSAAASPEESLSPDPFADMFAFVDEGKGSSSGTASRANPFSAAPVAAPTAARETVGDTPLGFAAPLAFIDRTPSIVQQSQPSPTFPDPGRSGPFPAAGRPIAEPEAVSVRIERTAPANDIVVAADALFEARPTGTTSARAARQPLGLSVVQGATINARSFVAPGTRNSIGWAVVAVSAVGLCVTAAALVLGLVLPVAALTGLSLLVLLLSGAGRVLELRSRCLASTMAQLPDLHACAKSIVLRLSAADFPRIFVSHGRIRTLRSVWWWSGPAIEIDQRFLSGCVGLGVPEVITFHLAREIGRHVLGHTRPWRRLLAAFNPWLGRHDVLSADRLALELCGDRNAACAALVAEAAGPALIRHTDFEELERTAASLVRERSHVLMGFFDAQSRFLVRIQSLGRGR